MNIECEVQESRHLNNFYSTIYSEVTQKISEKWTSPLSNWALTISQLDVYFEGRLKLHINL